MSSNITQRMRPLEQWYGIAFLIGGAIFVVDAALLVVHLSSGTQPAALGQMFVGASWTIAFVGLLGFYPGLADRSRWLSRIGAVFAVVGGITMAAMAVTMFSYASGVASGEPGSVTMYFLPGVFAGIVFGFGSFSVASLRTDVYAQSVGALLLLLPITFLFNIGTAIAGFNPLPKILGVVCVLALTMLSIGYLLRTGGALVDQEEMSVSGAVNTG